MQCSVWFRRQSCQWNSCLFVVIKLIKLSCYPVTHFIKIKWDYQDACSHTFRGCNGNLTRCSGVRRGSAGGRNWSRAWSRLLGLSGACGRAHGRGRGSASLACEVRGGVRREGGLSLVTGTPLLPLATAAGGAASADGWAQTSLRPSGEVINWAGQILEQKKGLTVSIYGAHPSIWWEVTCSRRQI